MAKENGRKTRDAALNGQVAAGQAITRLCDTLAKGSADPVEYVKAIGQTLKDLQAVHGEFESILDNCALEAVRGSYKD